MSDLVVKQNNLINASYSLSLVEQRLLLLAIVEWRKESKLSDTTEIYIYADSYAKRFDTHQNTAYQALKDACKELMARQFSYQDYGKDKLINKTSRWVSEVGYAANDAFVTLKLAPIVVLLITELEQRFTTYNIEQIAGLSSGYAVRLFELLMCWQSTGKVPPIEIQELKSRLGVLDGEYVRMHHFKARVLDLAVKQINDSGDIKVEYEQHRKGRGIGSISFSFKQKKVIEHIASADAFIKLSDSQINMFSSKLSTLPELGSSAPVGASAADYAKLIADDLRDKAKQKKYIKYLGKVGYTPSKRKS